MYIYIFKNILKEKKRLCFKDEGLYFKFLDCNVCKMRMLFLKII